MNKDTVAEKNYLKPNWSEKILRTTIQSYSEDLQLAKKIMNEINDSNICQFKLLVAPQSNTALFETYDPLQGPM